MCTRGYLHVSCLPTNISVSSESMGDRHDLASVSGAYEHGLNDWWKWVSELYCIPCFILHHRKTESFGMVGTGRASFKDWFFVLIFNHLKNAHNFGKRRVKPGNKSTYLKLRLWGRCVLSIWMLEDGECVLMRREPTWAFNLWLTASDRPWASPSHEKKAQ